MFSQEMEDLIQVTLQDGMLTDQEKAVLVKRAQKEGIDVDELDVYIQSLIQKRHQAAAAADRKTKIGEMKRCPFCGGSVPQLADKCPHCGETITAEASEELQEIFDHLEEALVDFKTGKDIDRSKATVERYVRKAKMYYENNPKVQKLLKEVQEESDKVEKDTQKQKRIGIFKTIFFNGYAVAIILLIIGAYYWINQKDGMDQLMAIVCAVAGGFIAMVTTSNRNAKKDEEAEAKKRKDEIELERIKHGLND